MGPGEIKADDEGMQTLPPDRKILELVGRETSKLLKCPYPPLIMSDNEDYGRDPRTPASSG